MYSTESLASPETIFDNLDCLICRTVVFSEDAAGLLRVALMGNYFPSTRVLRKMAPSAYRQKTRSGPDCFHTAN